MKKIKRPIQHLLHEALFHYAPSKVKKNLLTCQEVSVKSENKKVLSLSDRLRMMIHTAACSCCSNYRDHVEAVSEQYSELYENELNKDSVRNEDFEKELIKKFSSENQL